MTTTSRVGAVIDALVTRFTAGTAAKVFDGPPVQTTAPGTFVLVGCNEDTESRVPLTQDWAGLGHHSRNEEGQVPCAIVSQSGDTVLKVHRDAALALMAELEAAVTTDPTLGGVVQAGWLHITSGDLVQEQTPNGSRVAIPITVTYKARLEGS